MVAGVEPRAAVQDTSPIRGEDTRQASHPTAKDKAVKNKGTRFVTKYCKLFKRNYNLSPYFKFKHGSALSKEGDKNQFACRPYKGVQRELCPAHSGSLGTTDSSGFPTTPCKSASSNISSPTITAVTSRAGIGINRDTGNVRETGHKGGSTRPKGFRFSDISGAQEGWRPQTGNKPEGSEQIYCGGALQDGGFPHGEGFNKTRGLVGQNRPEGCLLLGISSPQSPEIPSISMVGHTVRVSVSQCLPFGLSCAPRTFTKLMKLVVALLRETGIRLIVYLDDILILCRCRDTLINQLRFVRDLFQVLGLLINEKKSQLDPSQETVFLGLAISTTTMQVSLLKEKVAWIQQEAKQLQAMSEVSVQKLAMLVGRTTAAKQAIRVAPLFHRHLQALINRVVPLASSIEEVKQCYHQMVELSVEARQELVW